ncbi:9894_t:CDS:1, partial [Diversispora eburnea]
FIKRTSGNSKLIEKKNLPAMKKPILHDLSADTKEWSSVEGRKFMTNNCKLILQVPSLTDEESSFNKMVEN